MRTISAARGTRWLALDRGELRSRILAEADPGRPGRVRVRVYELAGDREHLAFEANVDVSDSSPVPAPAPVGAPLARPQRWTAADFYRDFAFHGPSYRGIVEVLGVAGEAIEAELEVLPRPAPAGHRRAPEMHLDPALLDCAGQLVGFWLLEGGRSEFGIFPFHLGRLEVFGPPPAPGRRCRARARVRWQAHGATIADVDFFDDRGSALYSITGFEQRYMAFPPALARSLFGAAEVDRDRFVSSELPAEGGLAARAFDGVPHRFLEDSWGIWGRALAHRSLGSAELADWYALDCSIPWLISRLVGKEVVQEWGRSHGLEIPAATVILAGGDSGLLEVRHPDLASRLSTPELWIEHRAERTTARLTGP